MGFGRAVIAALCVVSFGAEAAVLEWIGKSKVVNHHLDVPCHVLEKKWDYGVADSGNMIIKGDNLLALKALLPRYAGKVKCIYIDPPYNTGNEGWCYNDNVNDPQIKKWLNKVVGKEGEDFTRHDKWLCMMYPRLKLLHQLMAEDGAIFISIDDNELYNLKAVCDEIFGASNFVANVCVENDSRARPYNSIAITHEYLLIYKRQRFVANVLNDANKKFKYSDACGGFDLYELRNRNSDFNVNNRPNLYYPFWVNPSNKDSNGLYEIDLCEHEGWIKFYPQESKGIKTVWRWGKEKSQENLNKVIFGKKAAGGWQVVKKYREATYSLSSVWNDSDISSDKGTLTLKQYFDEKRIFAFPKSPELIARCLKLACGSDSIVLDSFAGSGTTAHAVLNLNKADGGNRKFILVEMCDYAETITAERVKRVIDGYGEGTKHINGTGGAFSFYELGEPLMIGEELNEKVATEKIREYIYYTEVNKPLPDFGKSAAKDPYLLGVEYDTAYYFCYEKGKVVTLDRSLLRTLKTKAEQYVIYADKCTLSEAELRRRHITFKKIPRDITRL